MISPGPKRFHKMLQKYVSMIDYELIAHRYGISKRTVEAIIQGRRNNPEVLTELVRRAKSNIDLDYKQISLYLENVTQINDAHFKMRDMYGVAEGEYVDDYGRTIDKPIDDSDEEKTNEVK